MDQVAWLRITFFVSQRRGVILSGINLQARADQTISKLFQDTSFMVTKTKVKVRKPTDCTTTFRPAIAPVDDITLRVQPLYDSLELKRGRAARH